MVLGVLALANTAGYAARNSLFTVYPDLRDRFGLHDAKIGLLTTAFLLPHALATLPAGWAGDRYDRRRVIAIGLAITALAGAAGAFATDVTALVISRALVGLGAAAIVPIANSIIGQLFDGPRKASRMAIFNLGVLLGGAVGFGVGAAVGFPGVVVVIAAPTLALAVVVMFLPVPDHPAAMLTAAQASMSLRLYLGSLFGQFWQAARELLRIRTLRWMMLSTAAMAFATGGYNAWLVDYLERVDHMTKESATSLLVITALGAVGGILAGARVADQLRARTRAGRLWTVVLGMTLTIPCAICAIELPPDWRLYVAGVATMFFISWWHAPMAVSVDDLAPAPRVAAAQGLVIFAMHFLGTAPSSYVVGLVSDRTGSLYEAMYVPTGAIVVAAASMLAAIPSFARDARPDRRMV
ncbi:MAG TPA: MFS transporter [Kofleriaceae bacterium]|nr:MFS transporter [Kofleriaceae bacterium]